jgi:hypothetical protein
MASDTESETSSTCSGASVGVGSVSMREDLDKVNKMLSFLKNFSPEKKKAGRQARSANVVTPNAQSLDKVIKVIDAIYSLNVRMLSRIDNLVAMNTKLKCDLDHLLEKQASLPSYSEVVSRGTSSPDVSVTGRRSAILGNVSRMPSNADVNSVGPSMLRLEKRLDSVEQDSLVKVMACQGSAVLSIIESSSISPAGNNADAVRDPGRLKQKFVDKMNEYDNGTLRAADIEAVDIIGKETKHLRVTFVSKEARNRTLLAVKRKKPENLFANEYLTKVRAALLFKLRTLKKANNSIERVYAWQGQVCAKTKSSGKVSYINSECDLTKFEESLADSNA